MDFIKFLQDNKALSLFKKNMKKRSKKENIELLMLLYEGTYQPYKYLCAAFMWRKTPEGFDYWKKLNEKWLEKIEVRSK